MFFKTLDLDKDGFLSRSDLNNSAKRFGWSWHEAPLLAVFDLLSISKPIPKNEFIALIHQIHNDPLGPYGNILLKSPHFLQPASLRDDRISTVVPDFWKTLPVQRQRSNISLCLKPLRSPASRQKMLPC